MKFVTRTVQSHEEIGPQLEILWHESERPANFDFKIVMAGQRYVIIFYYQNQKKK